MYYILALYQRHLDESPVCVFASEDYNLLYVAARSLRGYHKLLLDTKHTLPPYAYLISQRNLSYIRFSRLHCWYYSDSAFYRLNKGYLDGNPDPDAFNRNWFTVDVPDCVHTARQIGELFRELLSD
uniref:Uncharacterized protein n=1 Tax=Dulem virus 268 TaxID=3145745 RepID=A0AAU8B6E1_9VIRU